MKKITTVLLVTLCLNANAQLCFQFLKVFKPIGEQAITVASVVSADFNNDGKTDLATTNQVTNSSGLKSNISILLGTGTGNFTLVADTFYAAKGASQIISADFNHDGKADLATANFS